MNPPLIGPMPASSPPVAKAKAEGVKIYLSGKSVNGLLQLDNSMLEDELVVQAPPGTDLVTLTVYQNERYVNDFSVVTDQKSAAAFQVANLLQFVPFEDKMTLSVSCSGEKPCTRKFQIKRSRAGIPPNPGRAKKSLTPLYQQIAADLRAGKPLVVTANVALWDASFSGAKRFPISDGNDPKHNLYWGAGFGMYHGFKNVFRWQLVGEKKDQMAVFKKVFPATAFWRQMGVNKPFEMYVVFNLYRSADILHGYHDFAQYLFGKWDQKITLKDGKTIEAGSMSRVVGYVGHMVTDGDSAIKGVRLSSDVRHNGTKGVFITSCLSAPIFSRSVLNHNTYGLLFTTGLLAPEAYVQNALFEALARGSGGNRIIDSVASAYASYHDKYPSSLFVTSESTWIDKFSSPYEGDSDGDGLDNRIDPEPDKFNHFERKNGSLIITTSTGKRVIINLDKEKESPKP